MLKKIGLVVISTLLLANSNIVKVVETELKPEDKVSIYESFLNNVDSDFFDSNGNKPTTSDITINGNKLNQFKSNINSLRSYIGLNNAFGTFTKFKDYNLEDELVTKLSGIPVHQKGYEKFLKEYERTSNGVQYVNPAVITWATKNLYISPNTMLVGFKAQEIYDKAFQTFFRRHAESYLYLNNTKKFALSAKKTYLKKASQDSKEMSTIHVLDFVIETYGKKLKVSQDEYQNGVAFGFWLRRSIDQTDKVLWTGLTKIMQNYDTQWFNKAKKSKY